MNKTLSIEAFMNFPKSQKSSVLEGILKRSNKNYGKAFQAPHDAIYWSAESLSLDSVASYSEADEAVQRRILQDVSYSLLREAFAIERAGMAFASKMVLLSDDLESRILYSQFAAQEAAHYQAIAAHIPYEPNDLDQDLFLGLLKDSIESCDRMTLTLIIQVFLEGWGLLHYKKLAKDCLNPGLTEEFKQILQDEANHHGSGVALFDLNLMTDAQRADSLRILRELLKMVAAGPFTLASILRKHLNPDASPFAYYKELRHEQETALKLQQLRRILLVGGAERFVEILDQESAFHVQKLTESR
jgi:hypothetical protein